MKECTKIRFETSEEARTELERIVLTNNYSVWKDKKPTRYYLCPHCGGYHLTSKPKITVVYTPNKK